MCPKCDLWPLVLTFIQLIFDSLIVEYVIRKEKRAVITEVIELTLLIARIGFEAGDLLKFDVTFVAVFRGFLFASAVHFALHTVLIILARQRTSLFVLAK